MKFVIQLGFILVQDNRPGAHVTLFGPSGRYQFRGDASTFDDPKSAYEWAFEKSHEPIPDGTQLVFATTDREAVGVVRGGEVEIVATEPVVERDLEGKPVSARIALAIAALPPPPVVSPVPVPVLPPPRGASALKRTSVPPPPPPLPASARRKR